MIRRSSYLVVGLRVESSVDPACPGGYPNAVAGCLVSSAILLSISSLSSSFRHRLASPRMLRKAQLFAGACGRACSQSFRAVTAAVEQQRKEHRPCASAAARPQGTGPGTQPRHCSSQRDPLATSIEELNQELASYFGGAAELDPAGSPRTAPPQHDSPSISTPAGPGLEQQAAALNRELLKFFGAPQPAQGKSTTAAAPALAAHIQSQAGPGSSSRAGSSPAEAPAAPARSRGGTQGESSSPGLTHVDATGRAAMVDVSEKAGTVRSATATARVLLGPEVFSLVAHNQLKKGDVLKVAQLAGVMGAKHTSTLIPLCHNILLSKVQVDLSLAPEAHALDIVALARTVGPTGVEMEALTAASVAALTVYDMVKAASKDVVITDIRLLAKSGGKSGEYRCGGVA